MDRCSVAYLGVLIVLPGMRDHGSSVQALAQAAPVRGAPGGPHRNPADVGRVHAGSDPGGHRDTIVTSSDPRRAQRLVVTRPLSRRTIRITKADTGGTACWPRWVGRPRQYLEYAQRRQRVSAHRYATSRLGSIGDSGGRDPGQSAEGAIRHTWRIRDVLLAMRLDRDRSAAGEELNERMG
jgi:hypothetical protein